MSSSKKLLLIEDNSRIQEKLSTLLRPHVGEVLTASDGIEGVLLYNHYLPDLIVIEQFLPLLSGEELVRRWRQRCTPAQLPIIMMMSSRFGQLSAPFHSQLNDTLTKPLHPQQFKDTILKTLHDNAHSTRPLPLSQHPNPDSFFLTRGDLMQKALPEVFLELQQKRCTGVLTLTLAEGDRRIALHQGELVYAESTIPHEQLRALLHKHFSQHLTPQELEQRLTGSGGRAILQKEALSHSPEINPKELQDLFHYYIREIITRCFFLTQGPYQFLEDTAYVQRSMTSPIDFITILLEGVRRYYTLADLRKEFSNFTQHICHVTPSYSNLLHGIIQLFPEISFAPHRIHQRPLHMLLEQLCPNPELTAQLLKTLFISGALQLLPTHAHPPHRPIVRPNSIVRPNHIASQIRPADAPFHHPPPPSHGALSPRVTQEKPIIGSSYVVSRRPITQEHALIHPPPTDRYTQEVPRIPEQNQSFPQYPPHNPRVTQERPRIGPPPIQPNQQAAQEFHLGRKMLKQQRYQEALSHFQRAFRIDPNEPFHRLYLGWSLYWNAGKNLNNQQQAIEHIEKVIQLRPDLGRAYFYLGILHKREERYEQAKALFRQLLSIEPHNHNAEQHLQDILATQKNNHTP